MVAFEFLNEAGQISSKVGPYVSLNDLDITLDSENQQILIQMNFGTMEVHITISTEAAKYGEYLKLRENLQRHRVKSFSLCENDSDIKSIIITRMSDD